MKNKTYNKKKIMVVFLCATAILTGLIGRLVYLMIFDAEYYQELAQDLHEREREIIVSRFGLYGAREQTQKEVADRLGISQSYISRLEKRIITRLKREILRMS